VLTWAFSITEVILDFSQSFKPDKSTSDNDGIRVKSFAILDFAIHDRASSREMSVCLFVTILLLVKFCQFRKKISNENFLVNILLIQPLKSQKFLLSNLKYQLKNKYPPLAKDFTKRYCSAVTDRDAGTMWRQGGRFSWKGTFELIFSKRCLQNIGSWTSPNHVFYLLDDRGVRGFSARRLCYYWSSMAAFLAFSEANS
jgi:hypothetical protein